MFVFGFGFVCIFFFFFVFDFHQTISIVCDFSLLKSKLPFFFLSILDFFFMFSWLHLLQGVFFLVHFVCFSGFYFGILKFSFICFFGRFGIQSSTPPHLLLLLWIFFYCIKILFFVLVYSCCCFFYFCVFVFVCVGCNMRFYEFNCFIFYGCKNLWELLSVVCFLLWECLCLRKQTS